MLTLRGSQGIGKSALVRKMGGAWYSDSISTMQGKEASENLSGVWLAEVGELAGMKKAEAEVIKLFISKQVTGSGPPMAAGHKSSRVNAYSLEPPMKRLSSGIPPETGDFGWSILRTPPSMICGRN